MAIVRSDLRHSLRLGMLGTLLLGLAACNPAGQQEAALIASPLNGTVQLAVHAKWPDSGSV
ncbi:MAG TPA: hypothetical protein VL359_20860, partial [bacterium]|nr:hypothetical protein [bacterium]